MEGCPAGLEYLTQIDQLVCAQQVAILESKLKIHRRNLKDERNNERESSTPASRKSHI